MWSYSYYLPTLCHFYLSIWRIRQLSWSSLMTQLVKNLPVRQEPQFESWVGQIHQRRDKLPTLGWRRKWHPTPVLLPGKSHGWRSLVGYSPWSPEESDTTERLHFHFSLPCIGEGNGNPLQCSCLENPRDGGAWWAAIYGVAQSRTQLKWLSSSNIAVLSWYFYTKQKV